MSTVKVRAVDVQDLPELGRIDRQIFGRLAYPYFVLRQLFDVHQEEILVADEAGDLRGYSIAVRCASEEEPKLAQFLALGVEVSHRYQGIGRQLAEESLAGLQKRGVSQVHLVVERDNAVAIRLYRSLGFEEIAYFEDYYGEGEPRLKFKLELAPRNGGGAGRLASGAVAG